MGVFHQPVKDEWMSQLRWDPLKRSWVIITNDRGRGPGDFLAERELVHLAACPFCYGNEGRTPHEVFALRPPGSVTDAPGWRVRVIPNKYPALRIEGQVEKRGHGLYDVMDGVGAHEVIIENPDHERHLGQLGTAEIADVLRAWRARLLDLRKDDRFRYLLLFKNHGIEAGAGIPHSHCQLIALPITPPVAVTELSVCRDYFEEKERCLICDLLEQERLESLRVIRNDGNFLVFAPFASTLPFELRIAPLRHGHDFALLEDGELESLAATLSDTLLRLLWVLHDPPYNFVLHNAPPMHPRLGKPDYWSSLTLDYHWHIELVPRLTKIAGFEWGTGFFMNPTPPEAAARHLREANLSLVP
jgi:UDPglucose--hexose-1-phosphate uridylyltransferase